MDKFNQVVERAIAERVFPGCVIGTLRDGMTHIQPYGSLGYDERAVQAGMMYDLASVTKSIPVASLAALMCAEGKCALDDSVVKYVPEITNHHNATIEDLLRYRVQGAQMSKLRFGTFEEVRSHALERGFDGPPGARVYTNLPAFVLGIVLERVGGAHVPTLAHRHFFEPLNMKNATFFPARDDCAPTEVLGEEVIQGAPHDESARVFWQARRAVGHAGLFSNCSDLLTFAKWLVNAADVRARIVAEAAESSLGWSVGEEAFMGSSVSSRAFGKTGFTGTSIVIDRDKNSALVILSNRTYPKRPADDSAIYQFRRDIADIFFGSL